MQEKGKKQPLLYIAQPELGEIKLTMQETYIVRKKSNREKEKNEINLKNESVQEKDTELNKAEMKEKLESEAPDHGKFDISTEEAVISRATDNEIEIKVSLENPITNEADSDIMQEESYVAAAISAEAIAELAEISEESVLSSSWRVKSFKDMTNEERVSFLIDRPHYIPRVKCKIYTKKDIFVGYVLAYKDGIVTIKSLNEQRVREMHIPIENIDSIQMVGL